MVGSIFTFDGHGDFHRVSYPFSLSGNDVNYLSIKIIIIYLVWYTVLFNGPEITIQGLHNFDFSVFYFYKLLN